ncbi:L-idonate 5-dehydrogenase [Roseivivax sp.]
MTEAVRVVRLFGARDVRVEEGRVGQPGPGEVALDHVVGGICGSDLHYFEEGGIGGLPMRAPIVLGHEAAGRIRALGPGVTGLSPGDLVAINPAVTCGDCPSCRAGQSQHCPEMRFSGSILRVPHIDGFFRSGLVVDARRCHRFSSGTTASAAAVTEPLAVCLHALRQAGETEGRDVLVTGAGPIGALTVAAARAAGAGRITVTDLSRAALDRAEEMGADDGLDVSTEAGRKALAELRCDLAFDCSAAAPAIAAGVEALRPRGTMVLVGVGPMTAMPLNRIVAKELHLVGTHRFGPEFAEAAQAIDSGRIDPRPIISHVLPGCEARRALELALDRSRAAKVQLEMSE